MRNLFKRPLIFVFIPLLFLVVLATFLTAAYFMLKPSKYYTQINIESNGDITRLIPVSEGYAQKGNVYRFTYNTFWKPTKVEYFKAGKLSNDSEFGDKVAYIEIEYKDETRTLKFFDVSGKPVADDEGVYGVDIKKDGEKIRITNLDMSYRKTTDLKGISEQLFEYTDGKKEARIIVLDQDGNQIASNEHDYEIKIKFEDGREIEGTNVDKAGNLLPDINGLAKLKVDYMDNGLVKSFVVYGSNGEAYYQNGVAGFKFEYDEKGNETKFTFSDENLNPVANLETKIAGVSSEFDDRGNEIKRSYFDKNGNPTLNNYNVAQEKQEYDDTNNLTKVEFYDVEDKPTTNSAILSASVQYKYDERRNKVEESYYNVDGNLTGDEEGVAIYKYEYDENNNLISQEHFDTQDKPIGRKSDNVAIISYKYDGQGRKIEESFRNSVGVLMITRDFKKVAGVKYTYDDFGRKTSEKYFGTDEKAIGYAGSSNSEERYEYNGQGLQTKVSYFNSNGQQVVKDGNNYVSELSVYNEYNQKIEDKYLDLLGSAVNSKTDDFAVKKYEYLNNNKISEKYFDKDGKAIATKDGVSEIKYEYDKNNRVIKERYFNDKGEMTIHKTLRYAFQETAYDGENNTVTYSYYDTQGKAANNNDKIAKEVQKLNNQGQRIEATYFGTDGKRVAHADGYSKISIKYDQYGNETENTYYNTQDQIAEVGDSELRYAYIAVSYTYFNDMSEMGFLDKNKKEIVKVKFNYDDSGKLTKSDYYVDGVKIFSV